MCRAVSVQDLVSDCIELLGKLISIARWACEKFGLAEIILKPRPCS